MDIERAVVQHGESFLSDAPISGPQTPQHALDQSLSFIKNLRNSDLMHQPNERKIIINSEDEEAGGAVAVRRYDDEERPERPPNRQSGARVRTDQSGGTRTLPQQSIHGNVLSAEQKLVPPNKSTLPELIIVQGNWLLQERLEAPKKPM